MRTLAIDRFEGSFAICEDSEGKFFGIELSELPKEAKEGDILDITDEGELSVNTEKTAERRLKMKKKQDDLWE